MPKQNQIAAICLGLLLSTTAVVSCAADQSSSDAAAWSITDKSPIGDACSARRDSAEINTVLMINQTGQVILIASGKTRVDIEQINVGLQIDDYKIDSADADAYGNLILFLANDPAVLARLKAAKQLTWRLPSGTFHANVGGLGDALERLKVCESNRKKPS